MRNIISTEYLFHKLGNAANVSFVTKLWVKWLGTFSDVSIDQIVSKYSEKRFEFVMKHI